MNPRRKLLWHFSPFYAALFLFTLTAILAVTGAAHKTSDLIVQLNTTVYLLATLASVLIAGLGIAVIWHIGRCIEKTREGARKFASGNLSFRLALQPSDELGSLSETLNQMAAQLEERISTINEQRNTQEAILGSMNEGVIAVDPHSAILQINPAASQLLGAKSDRLIGRNLQEIMRNRDLNQMIEHTLRESVPTEGEIIFYELGEKSIQVHCTPLRSATNTGIGALVVLNDITRLRRLERVRRDFVANVSHELKTPLTSIKGFVETLQEGALDQPEEAQRFLGIIAKQVNRLQAIIEDLLSLSRIEQDADQDQVSMQHHSIAETITNAVQLCSSHATSKNIKVDVSCDSQWKATFNAALMEQVMVNLIDNAIKYSEADKTISISVRHDPKYWEIAVADHGCGIEQAHLSRIFERFYRVDKARSRKAGGTGLGLSIVKHIVTTHGGLVRVESKPGSGSTFTVCLPHHDLDVC